jgi:hypothetical protein
VSTFVSEDLACPQCGRRTTFDLAYSVNGGSRPDHRAAILDDSLQRGTCAGCGFAFRAEPELTYVDVARNEWVLVQPADKVEEWADLEREAERMFADVYGPRASPLAREIGRSIRPRIVFGWPALREKLLCGELGLDDVALEALKTFLMGAGEEVPLSDSVELRLVGGDGETLSFAWLDAGTGRVAEELSVPRAMLETAACDPAFEPLRDSFSLGPYVDMNRLLVPDPQEAP